MAQANCPKCGGTGYELVRREAAGASGAAASPIAVLCGCVQAERGGRALDRARIPSRYQHCDFESFETDYYEGQNSKAFNSSLAQAKLIVEGFARDYPLTSEVGLLLMGTCGVGKTHLATATLRAILARGHEAFFYDYRELLKEIQDSYNPQNNATEMSVLEPVLRVEVLMLDDLGASKPSAWALETIGHILNARYNEKRVTIITTNYLDTPEDSGSRDENLSQRIGARIRSRLHEMCRTVMIHAPDFRHEVRKVTGLHR